MSGSITLSYTSCLRYVYRCSTLQFSSSSTLLSHDHLPPLTPSPYSLPSPPLLSSPLISLLFFPYPPLPHTPITSLSPPLLSFPSLHFPTLLSLTHPSPSSHSQPPFTLSLPSLVSSDEALDVLALGCPEQHSPLFYRTFIHHMWNVFSHVCRDISELQHMVSNNHRSNCADWLTWSASVFAACACMHASVNPCMCV